MTNKQPVPILTAHMASQFLHFGSWEMPDKLFDPFKASMKAIESGAAVVIDASELEMFKQCQRLLYGFMLDTNAIGLTGAAENLARGIKDHAITPEKAG